MSEIRNLTRNGETFYPLTHVDGVIGRNGVPLGEVNGILDVSEYNASGDPLVFPQYDTLSLALADVPQEKRKGGMTIRYIDSTSEEYVQYRYMSTSTLNTDFINTSNWQGISFDGSDFDNPDTAKRAKLTTVGAVLNSMDVRPTEGSVKPVQSGGVYESQNLQYGLSISISSILNVQCRIPSDVTYINSRYLSNNASPVLTYHQNSKVTSPIQLFEGETIVFRTNGSGICFIALTDSDGTFYTKVVGGNATSNHIYTYTATENCYVALSGVYNHSPVRYIGFEYGIVSNYDAIRTLLQDIDDLEQKDAQQDDRIEVLEEAIPHSTDIYNGQDAGNYLVSFSISSGNISCSIVPYTSSHFTAQIPLIKDALYLLPLHEIGAYNMAVANSSRTVRNGYVAGKPTTGTGFTCGSNVQIVEDKLQFVCPGDNLYLFINLKFGSSFDYTDSFYLLEGKETIQEQIDAINQKDAEQDNRIEVLEGTVGGDTRFSDKTIYVLGDSITWLGGDNCDGTRSGHEHQGWTEYFKERIKPLNMKSYARSGATLCCFSTSSETTSANYGSPHKDNIVWNQVKRMQVDIANGAAQPNYIIIAAGINDAMIINSTDPASSYYDLNQAFQNVLVGTAEDVLNSNISTSYFGTKTPSECDSLLKTIRWIKEACISICPDAQIVLLTPLQAALAPLSIQKQVSDIIEDAGLYISATVINQRKQCGISRLQEAKGVHFTYDNTHTSIIGAKRVGYILAEILKSVFY